LIESWDGFVWSVTSSPNKRGANDLNSVSCSGFTACVAVGYHDTRTNNVDRTLIETGT